MVRVVFPCRAIYQVHTSYDCPRPYVARFWGRLVSFRLHSRKSSPNNLQVISGTEAICPQSKIKEYKQRGDVGFFIFPSFRLTSYHLRTSLRSELQSSEISRTSVAHCLAKKLFGARLLRTLRSTHSVSSNFSIVAPTIRYRIPSLLCGNLESTDILLGPS